MAILCFAVPSRAAIPLPDFSEIRNVDTKKNAFFSYLRPFVIQANQAIEVERRWVASLNFTELTRAQTLRVKKLVEKYHLKDTEITPQTQRTLLKKIDRIPESLALAQAANESAWGSSRFARKGNNFFGQWCFTQGCGLVPLRRAADDTHEVKKFDSPLESVKSYMLMLNSHPAFKSLRQTRLKARQKNQPVNGLLLVSGLTPYSALKEKYVEMIASMIRTNRLMKMDS